MKKYYLHGDAALQKEILERFEVPVLDDLGDLTRDALEKMTKVWKVGVSCASIAKHMNIKHGPTVKKYVELTIKYGAPGAYKIACRNLIQNAYFYRNGS